jgi:hypothetical protein
MDQVYKNHNIQVSSWLIVSGWKPSIIVTYSEGGKNILKNLTMDRAFPTCVEAERAGLAYVRDWIDERQARPRTMTREEIEKQMGELARQYVEIHDKQIIEELYRLGRELEKIGKLEKQ